MAGNWNPKYKINLLEVFSRAYASEDKELRSALRPSLSSSGLKVLYGNFVIDKIVDKTQKNLDKNGKSMGTYTDRPGKKDYKDSLEFKIWKGRKSLVDLTQTGNMLSDINPTQKKFVLVFGFNEQINRNKAQGHITGEYGKTGRTSPRDFFGLTQSEEEDLLRKAVKAFRGTGLSFTADLFDVPEIGVG